MQESEAKEEFMQDSRSVEPNLREVTCTRSIQGNFTGGVMDFNFQIGSNYGWNPSKSYFRVELKLLGASETSLSKYDVLTLADNPCAGLFSGAYFKAGGADVSSMTSYVAQTHQIKQRLGLGHGGTASWAKVQGMDASFNNRLHKYSWDGEDSKKRMDYAVEDSKTTTSVAVTTGAVGFLLGAEPGFANFALIKVGHQMVLGGITYTVTTVPGDALGTGMVVSPAIAQAATLGAYFIIPNIAKSNGSHFFTYQPPLGIFDHDGLLGASDFRVQLNPNSSYKSQCIQSLFDGVTDGATSDYLLSVENIVLYTHIERVNMPPNVVEKLYLTELDIQTKQIPSGSSGGQYEFSVPSSTKKLVIFLQESALNPLNPVTVFKDSDNLLLDMRNIQVSYANKDMPSTNWESRLSKPALLSDIGAESKMQQRYYDTLINAGTLDREGGTESYEDWLERGPIYCYDFSRPSSDRSTHVNVRLTLGAVAAATTYINVCAVYDRIAEVTSTNGYVTSVRTIAA